MLIYHFIAFFTIFIWGTTMVSSKVLLMQGLLPADIMIVRFVIGYCFLWILYPHRQRVAKIDEWIFLGMGIFSGSLYFFLENTALIYTQATNVSLLVATIPLFSAVLSNIFFHDTKLSKSFWIGTVMSMVGVVLVIFNGSFVLKINPFGDFLALLSVFSWAVYCLLMKMISCTYNSLFVARKIFFYAIVTMLPYFVFYPSNISIALLQKPVVYGNLLFLGIVASALCYWMWTVSLRRLGIVTSNNYVYFSPLITIITAYLFLGERITIFVMLGTVAILFGLFLASYRRN